MDGLCYAFMLIPKYSLGNVVRYGFLSKGNGIIDIYKAWCHDDDHCYFLVTFFSISSGNVIDILTQESTAGLYTNDFVKEISINFCDEYTACCDNEDAHNLKLYAAFLNFLQIYPVSLGRSFHSTPLPPLYPTKCRMTHAIQLLSDPDNSISEIAGRLHFSDQYSFTKSFKKYYGETPGKFRKQHFYVHNAVTSLEYL